MGKMGVDNKILEEIKRFKKINNYIMEQDAPPPIEEPGVPPPDLGAPPPDLGAPPAPGAPPAAPGAPPAGGAPPPAPPAGGATPTPVDVAADKDVEEIGDKEEDTDKEELEITDLVDAQKNIEQKQEEYFNNLFKQLSSLEQKLGDMDQLVSKIDSLETKIEKMRPKTPKEKLELRTLDSGPFNQKLSDFFTDKQEDMEKSGKNEYVLTSDEIEQFSKDQIEDSFYDYEDNEDDTGMM
jgi:hypothetical protein